MSAGDRPAPTRHTPCSPERNKTVINRIPRRRLGAALVAVPLVAALAACGTSSSQPSSAGGTSGTPAASSPVVTAAQAQVAKLTQTPTKIPDLPALPSAPPAGKTIVFLNQPNVSAVVTEGQGVQAAAEAIGWNYVSIDYDSSNPASLQQAMTTALTKNPAAVALVGAGPSLYGASIINQYKSANIPIIAAAVNPVKPGADGTVLTTMDNSDLNNKLGTIAANWAIADSGGTANVLLLHVTGFEPLDAYVKGFNDTIARCTGCHVTEADATLADVGSGQVNSIVTSKLRQNPDINYLVYDEGDWAGGINSALSAAGIKDVKIGGEDPATPELAAVAAGQQSAWAAHAMKISGYLIVDDALRALEGVDPQPAQGDVPIQIVTPDNIDGRTSFDDPADALDQFKKLWNAG